MKRYLGGLPVVVRGHVTLIAAAVVAVAALAAGAALAALAASGAPTNTALPVISDQQGHSPPQQGDTLQTSTGSWSGSPTSYVFQWRRCDSSGNSCFSISGATSQSYTLVLADVGKTLRVVVTAKNSFGSGKATSVPTGIVSEPAAANPIQHVVVIYQENHSFDNLLGRLCVQDARCDGVTSATLSTGTRFALKTATDVVPAVDHGIAGQTTAVDGGRMDKFDKLSGCTPTSPQPYGCLSQFDPSQIPNVAALARAYAISDRTFQPHLVPSWAAHLELVSASLDGFVGANPRPAGDHAPGPGWGCDSFKVTPWQTSAGATQQLVPSCIPTPSGAGPYKASPVQWVPTIMDRLEAGGRSWRIYATKQGAGAQTGDLPYGWAVCPTFADCITTSQATKMVDSAQITTDAANGALPNLAIVMPSNHNSQHNGDSMAEGDDWIGAIVDAIDDGPQWNSTAIFITWDDCGCFYDHVPPPAGLAIRVPMIIVSPYAKRGYTDSTTASFASLLAFTEHTFGLAPLATADANAYDYANSFNFSQQPQAPLFHATTTTIPAGEQAWLKAHPADPNDPT